MSVRVLLAVVFTVVLLAAVTPAVEDARDAHTSAAATRATDSLSDSASELVEDGEPPPAGIPGPVRTVTIHLPPQTALVLANGSRIVRTIADARTVESTALPIHVYLSEPELRVTGRVTLRLTYERRADGPVLVITRGFIRENEAKKGYAFTPGDAPTRARPSSR